MRQLGFPQEGQVRTPSSHRICKTKNPNHEEAGDGGRAGVGPASHVRTQVERDVLQDVVHGEMRFDDDVVNRVLVPFDTGSLTSKFKRRRSYLSLATTESTLTRPWRAWPRTSRRITLVCCVAHLLPGRTGPRQKSRPF